MAAQEQKTLKIDVKTPAGKVDGAIELPAELFDVPANIALMHQVVTAQRAAHARVYGPPPDRPTTAILSMPSVSAMVRRSSANAKMVSY